MQFLVLLGGENAITGRIGCHQSIKGFRIYWSHWQMGISEMTAQILNPFRWSGEFQALLEWSCYKVNMVWLCLFCYGFAFAMLCFVFWLLTNKFSCICEGQSWWVHITMHYEWTYNLNTNKSIILSQINLIKIWKELYHLHIKMHELIYLSLI